MHPDPCTPVGVLSITVPGTVQLRWSGDSGWAWTSLSTSLSGTFCDGSKRWTCEDGWSIRGLPSEGLKAGLGTWGLLSNVMGRGVCRIVVRSPEGSQTIPQKEGRLGGRPRGESG